MRERRRLAREVVELAWVAAASRNDRHDVSVIVLVVAPALQLVHVAAADDRVGGEQADAAQDEGAGVALALLRVVERRVAAVRIPADDMRRGRSNTRVMWSGWSAGCGGEGAVLCVQAGVDAFTCRDVRVVSQWRLVRTNIPKKPQSVHAKLAKEVLMMDGRMEESVPCHAAKMVTSGYDAS